MRLPDQRPTASRLTVPTSREACALPRPPAFLHLHTPLQRPLAGRYARLARFLQKRVSRAMLIVLQQHRDRPGGVARRATPVTGERNTPRRFTCPARLPSSATGTSALALTSMPAKLPPPNASC